MSGLLLVDQSQDTLTEEIIEAVSRQEHEGKENNVDYTTAVTVQLTCVIYNCQ